MTLKGGSAEDNERRWQSMTQGGPITKSGISGFMGDIQRGRIAPSATELARTIRSLDTKRMQREHDSVPVIVSEAPHA
jgi:hypothetical protein